MNILPQNQDPSLQQLLKHMSAMQSQIEKLSSSESGLKRLRKYRKQLILKQDNHESDTVGRVLVVLTGVKIVQLKK